MWGGRWTRGTSEDCHSLSGGGLNGHSGADDQFEKSCNKQLKLNWDVSFNIIHPLQKLWNIPSCTSIPPVSKSVQKTPTLVISRCNKKMWLYLYWGRRTIITFPLNRIWLSFWSNDRSKAGATIRSRIRDLVPNGTKVPKWSQKSPDFASQVPNFLFYLQMLLKRGGT